MIQLLWRQVGFLFEGLSSPVASSFWVILGSFFKYSFEKFLSNPDLNLFELLSEGLRSCGLGLFWGGLDESMQNIVPKRSESAYGMWGVSNGGLKSLYILWTKTSNQSSCLIWRPSDSGEVRGERR
jgi:hypothetical protein